MIRLKQFQHKKLTPNYHGSYTILQIYSNQTATLQISKNKLITYHFNLVKIELKS